MKETLICTLEKHYIYYLNNSNYGFYISIPFKDYTETNISIRLKSNYQSYDLSKNSLDVVREELINYYKNLDNYNVTLILPVFFNDILSRIMTVEDTEIYHSLDLIFSDIFNSSYKILSKNNIKVNQNIYIINNDSFKKFTNWYVARYSSRIEYKTILELVKETDHFNSYNLVETPNINFVVGKNKEPAIDKTVEIEVETFDSIANEMPKQIVNKKTEKNAGNVSYILLGVITFIVSITLLYILIK